MGQGGADGGAFAGGLGPSSISPSGPRPADGSSRAGWAAGRPGTRGLAGSCRSHSCVLAPVSRAAPTALSPGRRNPEAGPHVHPSSSPDCRPRWLRAPSRGQADSSGKMGGSAPSWPGVLAGVSLYTGQAEATEAVPAGWGAGLAWGWGPAVNALPSCARDGPPARLWPRTLGQDCGGQASHRGRRNVRTVAHVGLGPPAPPLQGRGDLGPLRTTSPLRTSVSEGVHLESCLQRCSLTPSPRVTRTRAGISWAVCHGDLI